eukprot:TRINITY_DN10680_c0_g1_i1.p1 TRINITY_DN10680_c0_g1~~TRINITY_DN10680_c0_g1_i1.p1  ORF type:complete len:391 (+),score=99.68 TRINITY_DN10680_c0_g1_i1:180-1352(+)
MEVMSVASPHEQDPESLIGALPNEVLTHIFSILDYNGVLASVCWRWNSVYEETFVLTSQRFLKKQKLGNQQHNSIMVNENAFLAMPPQAFATLERRIKTRPNVIEKSLMLPLFLASCMKGNIAIVSLLLNSVDPSYDDNRALRYAAKYNQPAIVDLLMQDKRVDPSDCNHFALLWAVEEGYTEVVRLLLRDNQINAAVYDNFAIREAAERGFDEIVRLLLKDPIVNPAVGNNTPLFKASSKGHAEIVKMLLADRRVDPSINGVGVQALQAATQAGPIGRDAKRILETDKRIIQCGLRAALRYDDDSDESEDEPPQDPPDYIQELLQNDELQQVLDSDSEDDPLDPYYPSSPESEGIYDNDSEDDTEQIETLPPVEGGMQVPPTIDKYNLQ